MKKNITIGVILMTMACGCSRGSIEKSVTPQRIISLAPSITETLFALGLGEKLVGVTNYCNYPPQARAIERIGDYDNANIERIITLKPDLVFVSREHERQRAALERLKIPAVVIDNFRYASVCSSFVLIGRICGVERAADSLTGLFRSKMVDNIKSGRRVPKVLVCVGRDSPGSGKIRNIFAAGLQTFLSDLIFAAGGRNVFVDSLQIYPRISREGLISLSPDIIIDIAPAMDDYKCDLLVNDWQEMTRVPAVNNDQVYCISEPYATLPGPRLLLLLNDFEKIFSAWREERSR